MTSIAGLEKGRHDAGDLILRGPDTLDRRQASCCTVVCVRCRTVGIAKSRPYHFLLLSAE